MQNPFQYLSSLSKLQSIQIFFFITDLSLFLSLIIVFRSTFNIFSVKKVRNVPQAHIISPGSRKQLIWL